MHAPKDPQARFNEALEFHQRGLLSEARKGYQTLMSEFPALPEILGLLGTLFAQQDMHTEAARFLRRAIATHPKNPGSWSNLGRTYLHQQAFEKALLFSSNALLLEPSLIDAIEDAAAALSALGRPDAVERSKPSTNTPTEMPC